MKVLLTGCTRNSGLTILRSLIRDGHEVVAADERVLPFGLHSRYVDRYHLLPPESSSEFVDSLLTLVRRTRPDVLMPVTGISKVIGEGARIERETGVLIPRPDVYEAVNDKLRLIEQCERFRIPYPRLMSFEDAAEALDLGRSEAVVIKPAANLGGGEGVQIVEDARTLRRLHASLSSRYGRLMISDYIPGPDSNNYVLQAVLDRAGKPLAVFTCQKLRLWPNRTGYMAAGVSRHLPGLESTLLPMLSAIGWVGPVDSEWKLDPRDGQMKLIEINGRLSGAVGFPMGCGVNIPELICQAAAGHGPTPVPPCAPGIGYWTPLAYLRSVLDELRIRRDIPGLLASVREDLRGRRVGNPYELRDLAPALGKLLLRSDAA